MKQTKTHIKIREFIEKFSDDPILGATSMNGQLYKINNKTEII